jgi:hypothetical protein
MLAIKDSDRDRAMPLLHMWKFLPGSRSRGHMHQHARSIMDSWSSYRSLQPSTSPAINHATNLTNAQVKTLVCLLFSRYKKPARALSSPIHFLSISSRAPACREQTTQINKKSTPCLRHKAWRAPAGNGGDLPFRLRGIQEAEDEGAGQLRAPGRPCWWCGVWAGARALRRRRRLPVSELPVPRPASCSRRARFLARR